MKILMILALTMLSGCSWFHRKPPPPPVQPELIVTGAPAGSTVFIDGTQRSQAAELNDRPQSLSVAEGTHVVEIHRGDAVVYRENIYVKYGEKRVVTVLSGSNRE
ncbi:MAG TPA: hypothetical protein VNW05_11290 [Steroidobacteraceae bacterium]|nr:hypothetical protein [Steroidobacteraceae bacterium]